MYTSQLLCSILLLVGANLCTAQIRGDNVDYRPGECLRGDRHKELSCPEPEGPEYEQCHQWSEKTCCTAEFTSQLAVNNIPDVDGFTWHHCNRTLSSQCLEYFRHVECFYRCSPHVAHWELSEFPSALANLPVCREFCDGWYNACAEDLSCATNWLFDWDPLLIEGRNMCQQESNCTTFSERYANGREICETLWGQSFFYSNYSESDPDRQCMTLWWPQDQPNPNEVAIGNLFGDQVNTVQPAPCGINATMEPVTTPCGTVGAVPCGAISLKVLPLLVVLASVLAVFRMH